MKLLEALRGARENRRRYIAEGRRGGAGEVEERREDVEGRAEAPGVLAQRGAVAVGRREDVEHRGALVAVVVHVPVVRRENYNGLRPRAQHRAEVLAQGLVQHLS